MFDVGADAPQDNVLTEGFGADAARDPHLLAEDELLDEHLLHDRIDDRVVLRPYLRQDVDDDVHGDMLHLNVCPPQHFAHLRKMLFHVGRKADASGGTRQFRDGQLFLSKPDRRAEVSVIVLHRQGGLVLG